MKRQVAEGLKLGTLHPLAAALDAVYEAADIRRRDIEEGGKFSPSYKRAQIDAIETETAALVEKVRAEHLKSSIRPLDAEEGQLRAAQRDAANDPTAAFREARAARFAGLMSNALSADEVSRTWADVLLTDDADAISAAASAGLRRHADLIAEKKAIPAQHSALQAHSLAFETAVDEWARAHPSPARRLATIERERGNIEVAIGETAAFCARLFGAGSKGRIAPGLHEGPGFDRRPQRRQDDERDTRMRVGPGFDLLAGVTGIRR